MELKLNKVSDLTDTASELVSKQNIINVSLGVSCVLAGIEVVRTFAKDADNKTLSNKQRIGGVVGTVAGLAVVGYGMHSIITA